MPKKCGSCHEMKQKSDFTANQWRRIESKRKCKDCSPAQNATDNSTSSGFRIKPMRECVVDAVGADKAVVIETAFGDDHDFDQTPSYILGRLTESDDRVSKCMKDLVDVTIMNVGKVALVSAQVEQPVNGSIYSSSVKKSDFCDEAQDANEQDNVVSVYEATSAVEGEIIKALAANPTQHPNKPLAVQSAAFHLLLGEWMKTLEVRDELDAIRNASTDLPVNEKEDADDDNTSRIVARQRNKAGEFQSLEDSLMAKPEAERKKWLNYLRHSSCVFEGTDQLVVRVSIWGKKAGSRSSNEGEMKNAATGINGSFSFAIGSKDTTSSVAVCYESAPDDAREWLNENRIREGEVGVLVEQLLHQELVDSNVPFKLFIVASKDGTKWHRFDGRREDTSRKRKASGEYVRVVTDFGLKVPGVKACNGQVCGMVVLAALYTDKRWFYANPVSSKSNRPQLCAAYGYSADVFAMNGNIRVDEYLVTRFGEQIRQLQVYQDWVAAKNDGNATFRVYYYAISSRRLHEMYPSRESKELFITKLATYGYRKNSSNHNGETFAPVA